MLVASVPDFGRRLKHLREQAGISMYELAKRSGVSAASLSRIEQGGREPTWPTIVLLARALGVSVAAFDVEPSADQAEPTEEPPAPRPRAMGKRK